MKKIFTILFITISVIAKSQYTPVAYKPEFLKDVRVDGNLLYSNTDTFPYKSWVRSYVATHGGSGGGTTDTAFISKKAAWKDSLQIHIGEGALNSITTGNFNTAIGYLSQNSTTSGYSNTSYGFESLLTNSTGTDNTSIGNSTLYNNSTGFANTSFGGNSLYSNTTGNYNIGLGFMSGYYSTTLSNRLYINSINRYSLRDDSLKSIIYGNQNSDTSKQFLYVNARKLIVSGDVWANGVKLDTGSGGGGTWGSITGTLSSQTDLQTALNAKKGYSDFTATSPLFYSNTTGVFTIATDATPTSSSTNPVQSGGVYSSLTGKGNANRSDIHDSIAALLAGAVETNAGYTISKNLSSIINLSTTYKKLLDSIVVDKAGTYTLAGEILTDDSLTTTSAITYIIYKVQKNGVDIANTLRTYKQNTIAVAINTYVATYNIPTIQITLDLNDVIRVYGKISASTTAGFVRAYQGSFKIKKDF